MLEGSGKRGHSCFAPRKRHEVRSQSGEFLDRARQSPFAFVGKMNREQEKPSEAFRLEKGNEDFIDFPLERTSEASPGLPPGGKILLHTRRGPSGLGSVS